MPFPAIKTPPNVEKYHLPILLQRNKKVLGVEPKIFKIQAIKKRPVGHLGADNATRRNIDPRAKGAGADYRQKMGGKIFLKKDKKGA